MINKNFKCFSAFNIFSDKILNLIIMQEIKDSAFETFVGHFQMVQIKERFGSNLISCSNQNQLIMEQLIAF